MALAAQDRAARHRPAPTDSAAARGRPRQPRRRPLAPSPLQLIWHARDILKHSKSSNDRERAAIVSRSIAGAEVLLETGDPGAAIWMLDLASVLNGKGGRPASRRALRRRLARVEPAPPAPQQPPSSSPARPTSAQRASSHDGEAHAHAAEAGAHHLASRGVAPLQSDHEQSSGLSVAESPLPPWESMWAPPSGSTTTWLMYGEAMPTTQYEASETVETSFSKNVPRRRWHISGYAHRRRPTARTVHAVPVCIRCTLLTAPRALLCCRMVTRLAAAATTRQRRRLEQKKAARARAKEAEAEEKAYQQKSAAEAEARRREQGRRRQQRTEDMRRRVEAIAAAQRQRQHEAALRRRELATGAATPTPHERERERAASHSLSTSPYTSPYTSPERAGQSAAGKGSAGKSGGGTPPLPPKYAAALSALDDNLETVLSRGDIRLVRREWLLEQDDGFRIVRAQELTQDSWLAGMPARCLLAVGWPATDPEANGSRLGSAGASAGA
jgi:hypothetical protein